MGGPTLRRIPLYLRTARALRWEQWVYRPIRKFQARLPVRLRAAGTLDRDRGRCMERACVGWGPGDVDARLRRADEVVDGVFRFLNHAERLPTIDWRHRHVSHLWSYNLHYFDYALDLAWAWRISGDVRFPARFVELAESWIRDNVPGVGDGWEPYPVSLRTVNWIYALALMADGLDPAAYERIGASIYHQLALLERRLELHILANHLQKNLKALVVGGLAYTGPDARRWLRRGARLLWRELDEQVLPDGGHFERSPMYHAIALGDFLEVLSLFQASGIDVPEASVDRIRRMVRAFGILSRPDGSLHLYNDAANGIAPAREWLGALSRSVVGEPVPEPQGVVSLPETGYYGLVDADAGFRLLLDCGAPGPSYQPGHAHCDLLSFELDMAGMPLVVDSGVSGYAGDRLREYVRSTRAHNTVMIGGREQSEIWSTFRMARRARVTAACQRHADGEYRFDGAYTPYFDRRVMHRRTIIWDGATLSVIDRVDGAPGAPLTGFLHLHPAVRVEPADDAYILRAGRLEARLELVDVDRAGWCIGRTEPEPQGWHCPEFGRAVPAPAIEMQVDRNEGKPFGYRIRVLTT